MQRSYFYAVFALFLFSAVYVLAQSAKNRLFINDKLVSEELLLNKGRYYVAIDDLAKALNATSATKTKPGEGAVINFALPKPEVVVDTGSVKGVITYYFNENFGDKVDTGAKIWLVEGELTVSTAETFLGSDEQMIIRNDTELQSARDRGNDAETIRKMVKYYKVIQRTTVDGNGNYDMKNIPVGKYTLFIQSKHRKELNNRDVLGVLRTIPVEVKKGQMRDGSTSFGLIVDK